MAIHSMLQENIFCLLEASYKNKSEIASTNCKQYQSCNFSKIIISNSNI